MKIEVLKDCCTPSHTLKKGDVLNMRMVDANKLIAKKLAEEVKAEKPKTAKKKKAE